MDLSHLLDRLSVDVEEQLMSLVDCHMAHLSVKVLYFRRRAALATFAHPSPQDRLPDFRVDLRAEFREGSEAGLDPLFHHHYRQGEDSSDYEPTQQPVATTDNTGIKLLQPWHRPLS